MHACNLRIREFSLSQDTKHTALRANGSEPRRIGMACCKAFTAGILLLLALAHVQGQQVCE